MSDSHLSDHVRVRVDPAGRVVIPVEFRQTYGIATGHELILSSDERGIHLQTFAQAVRSAQDAFAPYRTPEVSVVDELIRERQEEAKREYDE